MCYYLVHKTTVSQIYLHHITELPSKLINKTQNRFTFIRRENLVLEMFVYREDDILNRNVCEWMLRSNVRRDVILHYRNLKRSRKRRLDRADTVCIPLGKLDYNFQLY